MELIIAVTNGIRAWGAAALLLALPVLAPFVVGAVRGALMAGRLEFELAIDRCRRRAVRVFAIALWREGWATSMPVNAWIVLLLLLFLAAAGGGIFIASSFSSLGYYDPALTVVMFFAWMVLALAGWIFTVTTAESPPGMSFASALLMVSFLGLALEFKGFV